FLLISFASAHLCASADWQTAEGPLKTRWAKDVSPQNAHPEYPRPQLVRKNWLNLNGLWDFAVVAKTAARPEEFQGQILVPFPIESALSGVMKRVSENDRIWYRRTFELPQKWIGQRIILHFGAVDFEAAVYLNGKEIGQHRGGYDGFSFDITDSLYPANPNELVVAVWDPTDAGTQPRGKQVRKPEGIWYTPTSGIWQTVWLEPVDAVSIDSLKIIPDPDRGEVRISLKVANTISTLSAAAYVSDGPREVGFDRKFGVKTN